MTWVDFSFYVSLTVCMRTLYVFLSEEWTEGILYLLDLMVLQESKWEMGVGCTLTCFQSPNISGPPSRLLVISTDLPCSWAASPLVGKTLGRKQFIKDTILESPEQHSLRSPRKFYLKWPLFIILSWNCSSCIVISAQSGWLFTHIKT